MTQKRDGKLRGVYALLAPARDGVNEVRVTVGASRVEPVNMYSYVVVFVSHVIDTVQHSWRGGVGLELRAFPEYLMLPTQRPATPRQQGSRATGMRDDDCLLATKDATTPVPLSGSIMAPYRRPSQAAGGRYTWKVHVEGTRTRPPDNQNQRRRRHWRTGQLY